MTVPKLDCVFLGLTVTSTWGNGHATTYRALLKELAARGHRVTFLERDVPWYSSNREFDRAPYCEIGLYANFAELRERYTDLVRHADLVVVGSYVPEGIAVGEWVLSTAAEVRAFYDIDTPVTLANLQAGKCEYIASYLYPQYDLYLSFTGGPTLTYIEEELGSPCARALYCSVDPSLYHPRLQPQEWDMAYLGTYAPDRQPALSRFLLEVARAHPDGSFAVAGPQYPDDVPWPANVQRIEHLPAHEHVAFYNSQKFTLNITRQDMVKAGYSPSVRLFEAAACGVPIITDEWPGLDTIFTPGSEILPVRRSADVSSYLQMPLEQRLQVAERARERILRFHTAAVRAQELERHVLASLERLSRSHQRRKPITYRSKTTALI